MLPPDFKRLRRDLGLTQDQLAQKLGTTRMTITRYETGTRRIPPVVEVAVRQLAVRTQIPMLGIVAAGEPIEPVAQSEVIDVPPSMVRGGLTFVLRVKGESMRDEGILPGDLVVVQKQTSARNGQTVVALVNGEATIKTFQQSDGAIVLQPANAAMHPIIVGPDDELTIEGVVIGVIRHCQ